MRLESFFENEAEKLLAEESGALCDLLQEYRPEDVAEHIQEQPDEVLLKIIRVLSVSFAADMTVYLPLDRQAFVLEELEPQLASQLLRAMSPDDRVDALQEVAEEKIQRLLKDLEETEPSIAEEIRELGSWEMDTAGGLMTTKFISLDPSLQVLDAFDQVRSEGIGKGVESIYYLYICGFGQKLLGVISLRDLILSEPDKTLSEIMIENVVRVSPEDDQEKVADLMAHYNFSALPVVSEEGVMLGMVTVDDVMDVMIQEATEDVQLLGGVVPLEDSYFHTGLFEFVWKRGAWLVLLFLAQLVTTWVMEANRSTIQATLHLVSFIPLIMASGGNAGSQSSTLVIRALAVGEMVPKDWLRVFARELSIGLALGLLLGAMGFVRSFFIGETEGDMGTALVISVGILSIVTMGTLFGAVFPLAIRKLGIDPAVSSTPFIASVVDVLGLIAYFALASAMIQQL